MTTTNTSDTLEEYSHDEGEEVIIEEMSIDENDDDGDDDGAGDNGPLLFPDHSTLAFLLHEAPVYAVDCHPSMPLVVSGGGDDRAFLWHRESGATEPLESFAFADSVVSVAFSSPDGAYVAAGSLSGQITVWQLSDASIIFKESHEGDSVAWLKWHPKGPILMVAFEQSGDVWLWSFPSGNCLAVLPSLNKRTAAAEEAVTTLGLFAAKHILTATHDGHVRLWDPKTSQLCHHYERLHDGAIRSACLAANDQLGVTGGEDGTIQVFQVNRHPRKVLATLESGKHSDSIECISSLEMGHLSLLVSGGLDGVLNIWDLATMRWRTSCQQESGVVKCSLLSDGRIISGGLDGVVRCWDARTGGAPVQEWHGHHDAILDLCVGSGDDFVVTGSDDGSSLVFQIK